MEERRLAVELLHEIKKESQRRFVLLVICIILLFASNMAWLVAWNLPLDNETVTESYELQGEDDANVVYNSEGEVHINGEKERENNHNENTNKENK